MYDKGLAFLAKSQEASGGWSGGYSGAGVSGMAVMAFLASGEDPNFGIYSNNVKRGLRSMPFPLKIPAPEYWRRYVPTWFCHSLVGRSVWRR